MAVIAVSPFILTDASFLVGTDNYEGHVSKVQFDPSSSIQTWKGLTPTAAFSAGSSATWTCTIEYAQDWATTNSLSNYLLANAGTEKEVVFKPKKNASGGTGPMFTATLIIQSGAIGGAVDAYATASVTLGVKGVPVRTVA